MLGFVAFLLKVGFLALPSLVAFSCVLATAAYGIGAVGTLMMMMGSGDRTTTLVASAPYSLWIPLLALALLPLVAFIVAAAYSLLLDLARSVLDMGADARRRE